MNPHKTRLQKMVREFNQTLGRGRYGCNDRGPSLPTSEEKVLGARMLFEEVLEYMDAAGIVILCAQNGTLSTDIKSYEFKDVRKADLTQCADALGDIDYITAGIANCYDFGMEEVHDEIHRSNMTKAPRSEGPLGKVVKGASYSPPDLKCVLEQQILDAQRKHPEDPQVQLKMKALDALTADEGEG